MITNKESKGYLIAEKVAQEYVSNGNDAAIEMLNTETQGLKLLEVAAIQDLIRELFVWKF